MLALGVIASPLTLSEQALGLGTYEVVHFHGSVASSPDAAADRGPNFDNFPDRVYVVVRGTDNNIHIASFLRGAGAWTGWDTLGSPPGGAVGDPALVSSGVDRLDLFVRGVDNRLWQLSRPTASSPWSNWSKPVGDDGILGSGPEVSSRGPGRLDVFVLGTDGQVYQRVFDGVWNPGWLGQGEPEGPVGLVGEPSSASGDATSVELFARGTDNRLWSKTWNGAAWSSWVQPVGMDGTLASPPEAVSTGPGHAVVFVRGTDQNLYSNERQLDNTWGGWVRESITGANPFQDTPGATARALGGVDAFVRGVDDKAYRYEYRPPVPDFCRPPADFC